MADWILVPCLVKLRSEFTTIAPNRDKSSDGSIGDSAHQATQSDHNDDEVGNVPIHDADKIHEVHAIDVDVDLREPGLTMETVVQFLLRRCRSGAEKRLRYIIFNRRIWQQSNGWKQQSYSGANPHDHHAHFSSSYTTSLEASTASWHLEDIPVALTSSDKSWIAGEINKVEERVWDFRLRNPYTNVNQPAGDFQRYAPSKQPLNDLSRQIAELSEQVAQLQKQVAALTMVQVD
ncbi:hypothetical protein ACGFJ7_35855 [Actinoplanes sp. NPDC048988]|uniref:hypothetical protein n=1 Tax=Actinoplanes sp. NPDC048988 TaxID=3363901 RepID=UPI0037202BE1